MFFGQKIHHENTKKGESTKKTREQKESSGLFMSAWHT
jgi:hypothetical protein